MTDLLRQYRLALERSEAARIEREKHVQNMNSPDARKKEQDFSEKEKQLQMVERQIGALVDLGVTAQTKCNG